jgi:hypothetical protein
MAKSTGIDRNWLMMLHSGVGRHRLGGWAVPEIVSGRFLRCNAEEISHIVTDAELTYLKRWGGLTILTAAGVRARPARAPQQDPGLNPAEHRQAQGRDFHAPGGFTMSHAGLPQTRRAGCTRPTGKLRGVRIVLRKPAKKETIR